VIKPDNRVPFPFFHPEITRNGGVVLVGFAEPVNPGVELALADSKPVDKLIDRDVCFIAPRSDKINYGVTSIRGNPDAG